MMGMPLIIADAMPTSTVLMPLKNMICGTVIPINPPIRENLITCILSGLIFPRTKFMDKSSTPPIKDMVAAYITGSTPLKTTIFEIAGTLPRTAPSVITNYNA